MPTVKVCLKSTSKSIITVQILNDNDLTRNLMIIEIISLFFIWVELVYVEISICFGQTWI